MFPESFYFRGALSSQRQFLATANLFKMMKNAIYFTLKALFVLKIFKFLFCLIRKIRLTSKIMTSQSGKQTIALDILPNISRSKGKSDNEIWSVKII